MKRCFLAVLVLVLSLPATVVAWNGLGHDICTAMAQQHLTSGAKKHLAKYLEGHDITYYSSWMDYLGYVQKCGYSNEWFDHCVPVNQDFQYAEKAFPGDALLATETAIERLKEGKYKALDDSTVLLLIKHLVHFLPDMHCPSHVIYTFRPSNYMVKHDGRERTFHNVWDDMPAIGPHAWSVTEWCDALDRCSKAQQKALVAGTPREWVHDNAKACIVAYDIVRVGEEVTSPDCYRGGELIEKQLLKAGYRLAYVLNMLFSK